MGTEERFIFVFVFSFHGQIRRRGLQEGVFCFVGMGIWAVTWGQWKRGLGKLARCHFSFYIIIFYYPYTDIWHGTWKWDISLRTFWYDTTFVSMSWILYWIPFIWRITWNIHNNASKDISFESLFPSSSIGFCHELFFGSMSTIKSSSLAAFIRHDVVKNCQSPILKWIKNEQNEPYSMYFLMEKKNPRTVVDPLLVVFKIPFLLVFFFWRQYHVD